MRERISLSAIWLQGCQVFYSPHNLDAVLWLTFSYCLQLVPSPAPFVLALVMAQDTRHKLAQLNPLIAVFFLSFFPLVPVRNKIIRVHKVSVKV